jgi:hypothetical protein
LSHGGSSVFSFRSSQAPVANVELPSFLFLSIDLIRNESIHRPFASVRHQEREADADHQEMILVTFTLLPAEPVHEEYLGPGESEPALPPQQLPDSMREHHQPETETKNNPVQLSSV